MKIQITNIGELNNEAVEIKATVYWRGFPRPNYEANETDEEYAERVKHIAKDINAYDKLHLGWATLTQETDVIKIPTVAEYDT